MTFAALSTMLDNESMGGIVTPLTARYICSDVYIQKIKKIKKSKNQKFQREMQEHTGVV